MRVAVFGTASVGEGYPRLEVLVEGLRRVGVTVERILVPLFRSHREKLQVAAGGVGAALRFLPRLVGAYGRLTRAWERAAGADAVLVGPLGHLDVLWLRCLPGGEAAQVLFDPFLGLVDTAAGDRALVGGVRARALRTLESEALKLADRILVDTRALADHLAAAYRVPRGRFHLVPEGQDDRVFHPLPGPAGSPPGAPLEVLFFGTYAPLHGVDTILRAAHALRCERVHFTLVGSGQTYAAARREAAARGLANVTFVPEFLPARELNRRLHRGDLCLGIFGGGEKAGRVLPLKAVAALAAARPLITRASPAVEEFLTHGKDAWLVPPADPEALAAAIRTLAARPALRAALARRGYARYVELLRPEALGRRLVLAVRELGGRRAPDV